MIIGAISAVVALVLVFLVALAIFLVFLIKRRGLKHYSVSAAPQSQNLDNTVYSQIIDSQSIEVKSNEAYSLSTTQQIPTEDNVAYGQATPQIPTGDNVAYGQATPQILTEDNVAYGQATPQIQTKDNIAYSQATSQLQITTGDNVAYVHREDDYATVSDPTEYDCV